MALIQVSELLLFAQNCLKMRRNPNDLIICEKSASHLKVIGMCPLMMFHHRSSFWFLNSLFNVLPSSSFYCTVDHSRFNAT